MARGKKRRLGLFDLIMLLIVAAVLAVFRFKVGMIPTLAACAGLGVLLHLAFGLQ